MEEVDALADRVLVLNQGAIVAEGTAAEIKSRASQRKIRCITRLDPDQVRAIPEVSSVFTDGAITEIRTAQLESVLKQLFARDPNVSGMEVSSGTLEEAFLKIIESGSTQSANHEIAQEMTA
jgi:ABC-2 type transport system ATP-binding protein